MFAGFASIVTENNLTAENQRGAVKTFFPGYGVKHQNTAKFPETHL